MAKKFLPAIDAGFYAALSTLGKIIFFGISPIIMVMFPITSEKHANGGDYKKVFRLSLLLITIFCLGLSLVYLFFPELMVLALYGKGYLSVIPYLKYFALIFSFFALSSLFLNYFISIKKTKAVAFCLIAAIIQILAICIFHKSLMQLTIISLVVMFLLFISLLGYYLLNEKRET